jgi:hypothetical protein
MRPRQRKWRWEVTGLYSKQIDRHQDQWTPALPIPLEDGLTTTVSGKLGNKKHYQFQAKHI